METLLTLVGSPVNALTLLIASGILVFQMADRGILKIGRSKERIPDWAQKLIQYTNHDTTAFHKDTHEKLDKLNETMTDVKYSIKSISENGIKCKKG